MDLTELQSELRSIGKKVKELETAVGQMKPKTEAQKVNGYKFLTDLASQYPLTDRGLDKAEKNTQNMYIKMLANIAFSEEDHQQERLLYIARIAAGIDGQIFSAEQIVELKARFDGADMENMYADIEPVKEYFLLDAFTMANICGKASEKILSILSELVMIFGCDREDIKILAAFSKGVLTDDLRNVDVIKYNTPHKWLDKLRPLIDRLLIKHRVFCGRYRIDKGTHTIFLSSGPKGATPRCDVESKLNTGSVVRKGEILVSFSEFWMDIVSDHKDYLNYLENLETDNITKTISAPIDGIVYFIEDDIKNDKIIYEKYMSKSKVLEIIKICEENSISYNVYTDKAILATSLKYNVLYYYKENLKKEESKKTNINIVKDMYEYVKNMQEDKFLKITICDDNKTVFHSIMKKIKEIEEIEVLDVSHMSRKMIRQGTEEIPIEYYYTEISLANVDKWNAIEFLIKKLDIEKEEVMTIGDNINDKKMIENAGLGIAMKGSTPVVIKIADDIAESNNEEGVAKILQKYYKNINF